MGYLDNTTLTIDAILTKRGRQLLSRGNLNITKFSISDDEVDYRLYDPSHGNGSNYYGEAIEKLPMLEAFADETQMMRHKLITLPRGTTRLPVIGIGISSISLTTGESITITPRVTNDTTIRQSYTITLDNSKIATITPSGVTLSDASAAFPATRTGGDGTGRFSSGDRGLSVIETGGTSGDPSDERISVTKFGATFTITGKSLLRTTTSTITIFGNETGGSVTIPITVNVDSLIEGVSIGTDTGPGSTATA